MLHIPGWRSRQSMVTLALRNLVEAEVHAMALTPIDSDDSVPEPRAGADAGEADSHRTPLKAGKVARATEGRELSLVVAGEGVATGLERLDGMPLVSTAARTAAVCLQVADEVLRFGYCSFVGSPAAPTSSLDGSSGGIRQAPEASTETAAAGSGAAAPPRTWQLKSLQSGVVHCSCFDAVDECLPVNFAIGMLVGTQH